MEWLDWYHWIGQLISSPFHLNVSFVLFVCLPCFNHSVCISLHHKRPSISRYRIDKRIESTFLLVKWMKCYREVGRYFALRGKLFYQQVFILWISFSVYIAECIWEILKLIHLKVDPHPHFNKKQVNWVSRQWSWLVCRGNHLNY